MARQWTLRQTIEWLWAACAERYIANPSGPAWHIAFHQSPSLDTPPDRLVLRAFRVLETDGLITGHVIDADNTDALWIRDLQLSDQGILQLEAAADSKQDDPRDSIGFSNE
jgi:hypothetical protein